MDRPVNAARPLRSMPLAAHLAAPVNDAVFKSAAAAALSSSLRPASRRTSQRLRSENAAGPATSGYKLWADRLPFPASLGHCNPSWSDLRRTAPAPQSTFPTDT